MVVFADSNSDTGRAFEAPAAHQYGEYGIGPFPWKQLYEAPDSDVRFLCLVAFPVRFYCTVNKTTQVVNCVASLSPPRRSSTTTHQLNAEIPTRTTPARRGRAGDTGHKT